MTAPITYETDVEHYERLLAEEGLAPEPADVLGIPDVIVAAYDNALANAGGLEDPEEIAATAVYELRRSRVRVSDLGFRRWRDVASVMQRSFCNGLPVVPLKGLKDGVDTDATEALVAVERHLDIELLVREMEPLTDAQRDILDIGRASRDPEGAGNFENTRAAIDRITSRALGAIAAQPQT